MDMVAVFKEVAAQGLWHGRDGAVLEHKNCELSVMKLQQHCRTVLLLLQASLDWGNY